VWSPSPRPAYVLGDVHGTKPAPSRRHVKVDAASLLVNANVAEALWLEAGGPEAIVVCGGTVSTIQPYSVAAPGVPPAESVRTANV
jgi:hypothetical protein